MTGFYNAFFVFNSFQVVVFVPPSRNSSGTPIRQAVQVLLENHFSDDSSEYKVSHNEFRMLCRGYVHRGGWWIVCLEKYCGFSECVCDSELVSECRTTLCAHANTCMHMFRVHLTICMLLIWFLLIHVAVIPLLLPLCLSVCTDGEGMMECWRVNLWFPGSWSGFIRSGCDNTQVDGPTQHLSYKHRSANEKPSWKE